MKKLRIALMNLEPYGCNVAIEKIRMYYQEKGDEVFDVTPFDAKNYDKVYVSSVFTYTNKSYVPKDAICGGTGFNLKTTLPPEIEIMKPKVNSGFTSRGCIRNCSFCIVPEKEGPFRVTGDIYDFWDRKSKQLIIIDNNILADKDHFLKIADQVIRGDLKISFGQGLDIRLLDLDIAKKLGEIKYIKHLKFAMDHTGMEETWKEKDELLKRVGIPPRLIMVYILIGHNTTLKEDLQRIRFICDLDHRPFIMTYNNTTSDAHNRIKRIYNKSPFHAQTFQKRRKIRKRKVQGLQLKEEYPIGLKEIPKDYPLSTH